MPVFVPRFCFHPSLKSNKNLKNLLNANRNAFLTALYHAAAALASTAWSHGVITTPAPRAVGAASLATCGSDVTNLIKADNTLHVEGLPEAAATDSAYNATECNLWL